jgi:hypothetical protein
VHDVGFPRLLDPVDDRPPVTVITHASRLGPGRLLVRGTTSDDGVVRAVLVNGRDAVATADNFAQWEAVLDGVPPGETELTAGAEDAAGNLEKLPHTRAMGD